MAVLGFCENGQLKDFVKLSDMKVKDGTEKQVLILIFGNFFFCCLYLAPCVLVGGKEGLEGRTLKMTTTSTSASLFWRF